MKSKGTRWRNKVFHSSAVFLKFAFVLTMTVQSVEDMIFLDRDCNNDYVLHITCFADTIVSFVQASYTIGVSGRLYSYVSCEV